MLKKVTFFALLLLGLTVVVNLVLSLISTFLPVRFVMPESLIEAPTYYNFVIGSMKFSISQTV